MASGYTRQSAGNIQAGLPIQAADLNNEFNQLQSAFDTTTGHDHSGSASGTGAKINLANAVTSVLPLANGGTNANLTANVGGILYSTASAVAILAGTTTANQIPVSGASAAPSWANISSLLTAGTGITITGTTNATVGLTSTTGSGAVVLTTSPSITTPTITGQLAIAQASGSTPGLAVSMPTGAANTEGAAKLLGNKVSLELLNAAQNQNWYFGINDADSNAAYIGRGYGPNQGVTPAIKITTGDVVSLANALPVGSGGTGATTQATAFANISVVASSITANGYRREPDGLIRQWGKATITTGNNSIAVSFPLAFPTATFSIVLGGALAALNSIDYGWQSATTSGFTITSSVTASGNLDVYWQAVGN